jgi:Rad3-related DNA helicase
MSQYKRTLESSPAKFIDDPDWARFIPETREEASLRSLPAHEDCSKIDAQEAALHLSAGGTLGRMANYEERPGQIHACRAIAEAFNTKRHLMIEAGTGVGKSLAYLVPSILWAHVNDTPTIISTATRNLQSQLVGSDIPKALSVLGDEASSFKVALLKGRTNYICRRSLGEFFASGYWTMSEEEQRLMPEFISWLKMTPDGDLDTYEGLSRSLITCPGEECAHRRCPYRSKCFVFKARKRASEANLVIVNHALVLADSSAGGGLLPSYGRIVFDEAHNLESIATEYLSKEFSLPALSRVLNRLIRHSKSRRMRPGGVLSQIERQLQKGVLSDSSRVAAILNYVKGVTSSIVRLTNSAERLSAISARLIEPLKGADVCRYKTLKNESRQIYSTRLYSRNGLFEPYPPQKWNEKEFVDAFSEFEVKLAQMVNLLSDMRLALEESSQEGEFNYLGDVAVQIGAISEALVSFANETDFVVRGEKDTHAYWVERVTETKRPSYIRLVAAPLSVADDLCSMFYELKDSVVFASATLRVGNDFKYMSRRLGCDGRFEALTAQSPFDYFRQSLVLACDSLPDPSADSNAYALMLADAMKEVFGITKGRSLVLFTSYEMMNSVASYVRDDLARLGIELLVQGEGISREGMTRRLKERRNTVVFGSQSFWEGVDVAGEALSCVVLSRLPFAQMGEPVIEARGEKIQREGGSSFRDYTLPEAVIKFRQGFGRLIRSKSDRGVVIVTDPRIVTKNYGAIFRKSIPATVHAVSDVSELAQRVEEFFSLEDS